LGCRAEKKNMPAQIFISYRRSEAAGHVRWLRDRLAHWFDAESLFYDQGSIDSGERFPEVLAERLAGADFLEESLAGRRRDDLRALSADLDGLPLALEQAASYLEEQALALRWRVLGEEHPDTSISAWNLFATLHQAEETEAARAGSVSICCGLPSAIRPGLAAISERFEVLSGSLPVSMTGNRRHRRTTGAVRHWRALSRFALTAKTRTRGSRELLALVPRETT